jgi:hypothetical protein
MEWDMVVVVVVTSDKLQATSDKRQATTSGDGDGDDDGGCID